MFKRSALALALGALVAAASVLAVPAAAADSFLKQHVRIELANHHKVVGFVIEEDDDSITIQLGAKNKNTYQREDVTITSVEDVWLKIKKEWDDAKTADALWAVAMDLEQEGFDRSDVRALFEKIVSIDKGYAKAQERLGNVAVKDDKGQTIWLPKNQAKDYENRRKGIGKTEGEMADRPWDEARVIVRRPVGKPTQYEIITNLPQETGESYADFMVELRKNLTELIEKKVGVKVPWQRNPCSVCKGSGKDNTHPCEHCGGGGDEPCKIYITNSHKEFMDATGSQPGKGGFYMPSCYIPADCERPIVAFHGTFGLGGNTFGVLAHEGTHQLEHLMWKGDVEALFKRPAWLVEGLAVYFGDGLDLGKLKDQKKFVIDIPQDRLAGLQRELKGPEGALPQFQIKNFTSFDYGTYSQVGASLYAYSWAIIWYMLNTKDKFNFKGKSIDLKDAFAKFFLDNCEKGSLEEFNGHGSLGLIKAMGLDPGNEKDAEDALDQFQVGWKKFVLDLPLKSVVALDPKDKTKKRYVAEELKFEFKLPGGKKKSAHEWSLIKTENLCTLPPLDQATALTTNGGEARVYFCCGANQENYEIDDALNYHRAKIKYFLFDNWTEFDLPDEQVLASSGTKILMIDWEGTEKKFDGICDKPRSEGQKGKLLIARTAARIYRVFVMCDKSKYADYEPELLEILSSFALTEG